MLAEVEQSAAAGEQKPKRVKVADCLLCGKTKLCPRVLSRWDVEAGIREGIFERAARSSEQRWCDLNSKSDTCCRRKFEQLHAAADEVEFEALSAVQGVTDSSAILAAAQGSGGSAAGAAVVAAADAGATVVTAAPVAAGPGSTAIPDDGSVGAVDVAGAADAADVAEAAVLTAVAETQTDQPQSTATPRDYMKEIGETGYAVLVRSQPPYSCCLIPDARIALSTHAHWQCMPCAGRFETARARQRTMALTVRQVPV